MTDVKYHEAWPARHCGLFYFLQFDGGGVVSCVTVYVIWGVEKKLTNICHSYTINTYKKGVTYGRK